MYVWTTDYDNYGNNHDQFKNYGLCDRQYVVIYLTQLNQKK